MRANYLAEDRPEIKFSAKEAARHMAEPSVLGMDAVKRIVRFLIGAPRLVQRMERQAPQTVAKAWSDGDWAGCKRTRKSTSSFVLMHGQHFIKMGSGTQGPLSLSSGESEW